MKLTLPVLLMICLSAMIVLPHFGCRTDKGTRENDSEAVRHDTARTAQVDYGALLIRLKRRIDQVLFSDDPEIKKRMVAESWDSGSGGFICVGKGLEQPDLPAAVREASRKKAAELTAVRWALYLKEWRNGNYVSPEQKLSGSVTYSTTVYESMENDTLFTLVTVPLGSIIMSDAVAPGPDDSGD